MAGLSEATRGVYDRNAEGYHQSRNRDLWERGWLDRVLADVPPGGAVLDLGCGGGAPIGEYIASRGFDLTGVDFAPAMLRLFARRLPAARAVLADMRALALDRHFDAIVGWGSFFHLTAAEQRRALPAIAEHLNPGGRLLLTVGPEAGEATGRVEGEAVYHASLSIAEYRAILSDADIAVERFAPNDVESHGHSLLLARRSAVQGAADAERPDRR
ncbi:class I SAM-dependent methyltransferase [Aestuariicoccus sp. MJ-SS9]|uniref:class I SAM-dependent DNA methyltransferase n=1 Tax=Aestuariicoccus sp. MJ-SS9 TaxID=3079855 RepID=UPI0029081F4F|nr:class I SAM-dependent methyltransferase [Aestuariicoccus sp. MJ-SS9]MDU8910272.1 class I SAM-dependent methyltransferase [Aestuariicoccus sp. MJ-SS9]